MNLRESMNLARIFVAVGSTRKPKLNAVREALALIGPALDPQGEFEVMGVEAPSGVSHTPVSQAELMAGARARAEYLMRLAHERQEPWSYFIGLEGGLNIVTQDGRRIAFLQNWAYVVDRDGTRAYGHSGGVALPEALAAEVLDRGTELAVAIDAFAGGHGIRDAQGAWGALTRDFVSRQEAFRMAVIAAFAPLFNAKLYERNPSRHE
jgi:inosine/xanthosine triphosphatase